MVRPKPTSLLLLVVVALPALLVMGGCGGSEEQALLTKYFSASRMRDNATLGNIATVSFSPADNGVVQSFDVVSAGQEEKVALKLKELKAAEDAARQADEAFNKEKKAYQDANLEAIERVIKAERDGTTLKGKDLEVQNTWTKWREDSKTSSGKLAEARQALAAERGVAEISAFDARNPVDPSLFDGDLITKDMVVKAKVKKGDAEPADQNLHVKFQRVDLRNGPNGQTVAGRWVITHISPADDGKTPAM
jgi:hypothetical protein